MFAINCPMHGFKILIKNQVDNQKRQEGRWQCPICKSEAELIVINDVLFHTGCDQCGSELDQYSDKIRYEEGLLAFFCDELCHKLYMLKLEKEREKDKLRQVENVRNKRKIEGVSEVMGCDG